MARKKNSLSTFDNALSKLGYDNDVTDPVSNMDDDQTIQDAPIDDDIDDLDDDNDPNYVGGSDDDQVIDPDNNDNTPIPNQDDLNNDPDDISDEQDGQTDSEADQLETQNVRLFFDAFAEELGWDVADDEKPDSMEGLINYIEDTVAENSKPQYADDRIAQLDAYVKNGGKFEDFYNGMSQTIEYDNMDMEDESNQKMAVRDYLKLSGYSDEQINKKIERYEDADMLEEEANDAVERLKIYQEEQLQQQQQFQQQQQMAQQEQARQFVTDLNNTISSLDNIRGVAIPKQDRKALFDYITKVDSEGITQYQRDFQKNLIENLIESAYFTMKGDALIGEAKRTGQTTAAEKLRKMLRYQTKNHSSFNIDDKKRSVADIASRWL